MRSAFIRAQAVVHGRCLTRKQRGALGARAFLLQVSPAQAGIEDERVASDPQQRIPACAGTTRGKGFRIDGLGAAPNPA